MLACRQWQVDNGFGDGASFAYSRGRFDATIAAEVAGIWSSARTVFGLHPEVVGTPNPHRLRSLNAAGKTLSQLKAEVDKAKNSRAWTILTFHGVGSTIADANDVLTADHAALIDYINAQGVAVRTVGEVMQTSVS